jgi:hypothetical protein
MTHDTDTNSAIDTLIQFYGLQLHRITAREKCIILAAFADHLINHHHCPFSESLNYQDVDGELAEPLVDCLRNVADQSNPVDTSSLMCTIAIQIQTSARRGDLG